METYIEYKALTHHPNFQAERQVALDNLDFNLIDPPLIKLVKEINRLPCLFTLQCCHGHFLKKNGQETSYLALSETNERVDYKLAFVAICIENSFKGNSIRKRLMNIPASIDRNRIQFCSAQWFWEQWINSYVLQVMPERFRDQDMAQFEYAEVREIGKVRDDFFVLLKNCIALHSESA